VAKYRLGPLGRMMQVEHPGVGWGMATDTIGALHAALDGTSTRDVFGHKARITVPLLGLDAGALSFFEMAYRGALGKLYFLDLQRTNRLSAMVSSTLSAWSSDQRFQATVQPVPVAAAVATLRHTHAGGVQNNPAPEKAASWTPLTPFPAYLSVVGYSGVSLVPVIPGETVVFSVYRQSGGAPSLRITPLSATLSAGVPVDGASVIAENLDRYYLAYTVPSDGSVAAVRPALSRASGGETVTIGWQLEASPSGLPTPWVMGQHAPAVMVESMPQERRGFGVHTDGSFVLREI
jgi:hypothetical protein